MVVYWGEMGIVAKPSIQFCTIAGSTALGLAMVYEFTSINRLSESYSLGIPRGECWVENLWLDDEAIFTVKPLQCHMCSSGSGTEIGRESMPKGSSTNRDLLHPSYSVTSLWKPTC